jgi:hypothetical protein
VEWAPRYISRKNEAAQAGLFDLIGPEGAFMTDALRHANCGRFPPSAKPPVDGVYAVPSSRPQPAPRPPVNMSVLTDEE